MIESKGTLMAQRLLFGLAGLILLFPSLAMALGLGPIEVRSALNEPLDARIPLRADAEELDSLRAELASDDAFSAAGLERPFALSGMVFETVTSGSGAPYLAVSTEDPVREPFIAFLADIRWSGGRLRREYTLFLDPPVYSERRDAPRDAPATEQASPRDATPSRPPTAEPRRSAPGTYQVRQGQTAWQVASAVRESGFSVHQTMMALLRANPEAFRDGNVNNLRAGVTLQVPDRDELGALSEAEARRQFVQQTEAWESGRQPAPQEPPVVAEEAVRDDDAESAVDDEPEVAAADDDADATADEDDEDVAAGEDDDEEDVAAVDDDDDAEVAAAEADADDELTDGRLQLRGAADLAGDDATQALLEDDLEATQDNVRLLQDQLVAMRDSEAALRSENEELRQMTDEMRARLDALERAVNLPADPGVAADRPDEPGDAERDGATGDDAEVAADSLERPREDEDDVVAAAEEPAAPAGAEAGPEPVDPVAQPEQTSIEAMLADPRLQYIGGAALLLLLLLILLVVRRRRQQAELEEAEYREIHSPLPASAVVGAAAGKGADAFAADEALVTRSPLEAADAALADGNHGTAREVINRGLILEPDNVQLRLRLLRLHEHGGDLAAFEAEAETLKRQVADRADPVWQEAVTLAASIGSAHPMFRAAAPAASAPEESPLVEEAAAQPEPEPEADEVAKPMQPDTGSVDDELVGDLDFDLDEEPDRPLDDGVPGAEDRVPLEDEPPAAVPASVEPETADDAETPDNDDLTLDFELDMETDTPAADADEAVSTGDDPDDDFGLDFAVHDDDDGDADASDDVLPLDDASDADAGDPTADADEGLLSESDTKLDLAQAYIDMGDSEGAKALLEEVMDEGSDAQKARAQTLLEQTSGES